MKSLLFIIRTTSLGILLLVGLSGSADAAPALNYQGRILVNSSAHNGNGYFKFALVAPAAAETFWTNDGTSVGTPGGQPATATQLVVSNGLYSTLLGGAPMPALPVNVFSTQGDIHLRVWFSTSPGGPFELLAPDKQLAAVGYALHAEKAAGVVASYDLGAASSLSLQSIAGGSLTFDATFVEPFTATPALTLPGGWTVGTVSNTGFSAQAGFTSQAVDTAGSVGTHTSIAMINGHPAISYRDLTESALKFVRANDEQGSSWPASSIVTVDGRIDDAGDYSSLAEVSGRPAISYYHAGTGELRFARAANPEGSSWPAANVITVDGIGENVGWYTSLAMVGGVPAISYYAPNAGELRYAWAGDADGVSWPMANRVVVDGSGAPDRGRYSSLIEVAGKPAIAYYDATNADLRYAYLSGTDPAQPGEWTTVTVDASAAVGTDVSLAVVDGNPAIAYFDATNRNPKFARASTTTGSTWPAGNVFTVDSHSNDRGRFATLSVFGGRPGISYYDGNDGDLFFNWAVDSQGTTWAAGNVVMVDGASAQRGSHASMASINGLPGLAYYDSTPSYDLRFASLPSSNWSASFGTALPALASGVKGGAITPQMLSSEVGIWQRNGNHLFYETGAVGIGRLPLTNDLEVEGSASKSTAGNWAANSDRRIKKDVEPVQGAVEKLQSVRLVSFRYTDDYRAGHPAIADRRYLNVIAQEFAQIFPEHVLPSGEFLPDGSEILQVDTYPLTIYAAAAVQELNEKLGETQSELKAVRARMAELERVVSELANAKEK